MPESTPRITASYLENFQHQTVRLIGRVTQLRGDHAVIDAGGQVTVYLTRDSHLREGNAVEVVGKVKTDLSIQVLMATDFGEGFDFAAAEAVVDATHRYKEIFYGDEE